MISRSQTAGIIITTTTTKDPRDIHHCHSPCLICSSKLDMMMNV
jgi:hypothetical protein